MLHYKGLSKTEVSERLERYWYNELKGKDETSIKEILLRQIKGNFMVYFLFFAILLSFSVGKNTTWYVISCIVLIIIGVWFLQEYKAEKALKSLKKMIEPVCTVIRDWIEQEIYSKDLVPWDIVLLNMWDKIPADCSILEEKMLRVNESMLTWESKEVGKKWTEEKLFETLNENIIFMWTHIVSWHCIGEVMKTGNHTEFGKISNLISEAAKDLPLQKKINKIVKYMATLAITVAILSGIVMAINIDILTQDKLIDILLISIAITVSAFPEWLPVVLISTLATWAHRMAQKNALVSRMSIIETLWETTVICSDKTWTITKWEMSVKEIYADDKVFDISWIWYETHWAIFYKWKKTDIKKTDTLNKLLKSCVICNEAKIVLKNWEHEFRGSPTEIALMVLWHKLTIDTKYSDLERLWELPFNSNNKMMAIAVKEDDWNFVYAKGWSEFFLQHCKYIYEKWEKRKIKDKDIQTIQTMVNTFAHKRYRVLCIWYKEYNISDDIKEDLIFLWLVALEDSPREWVKEAIQTCYDAGIKVKMITWDNKETAQQIAKEVWIVWNVLSGEDMDNLSDNEFSEIIQDIAIFARVKPEHKIRIVKILKNLWEIVTMTWDWVNDAPALKEAHIGVAMWKTGTDVSREAADLILKDDNFITIVEAIKEWRWIFKNIQKFVVYQLSCNLAELVAIFIAVLIWLPAPLIAIQILFMNLVTDNLPALTLWFTPAWNDVMNVQARKKSDILNNKLIMTILALWLIMGLWTLIVYVFVLNILHQPLIVAQTAALVTLILFEIFNAFNFRSLKVTSYKLSFTSNKYLVRASGISLIASVLIIYTPLNKIFETTPIWLWYWVWWFLIASSIMIFFDILKVYLAKKNKTLSDH